MISFVLAVLVIVGFLVNIPFYIHWLKQQKPSRELFLYNVRGKYTYYSVLDLISRIENETGTKLKFERKKIAAFKAVCDKRNVPIKAYKKKIHRLLKDKAFGKKMMRTSFKRMPQYTKVTAVWNLLILLAIVNAFVNSFDPPGAIGRLVLLVLGTLISIPIWLGVHRTFNSSLKGAAERWSESKKEPAGLHLAMAQFWGFTGGLFWKDLVWQEGYSQYYNRVSDYRFHGYSNYSSGYSSSGYGGFSGGDFGGGGAGGDW